MNRELVAGVDYGSDSIRVVLVEVGSGVTVAEGVCQYPRWEEKKYCDPMISMYRQHPLDYIEGLERAMETAIKNEGNEAGMRIVGIGIDTTGSTPVPVDKNGTPLALLDEFRENPNAMFHLWKDHTAVEEAKEVNKVFSTGEIDYTQYQGIYSSEWYWAKILHTTRIDPEIREKAWTWEEHCDWLVGLLVGNTIPEKMYHCSCAAGHKALWHSTFQGLPSRKRLVELDEYLGLVYDRFGNAPLPAGKCVGTIAKEWAERLHINPKAVVGGCSFDAHAGGVGAGVCLNTMVEVVGTSTVNLLVEHPEVLKGKDLRAFCGQAEDSIVPGYVGLEMSQPAFGDAYAWLKEIIMWPLQKMVISEDILSRGSLEALIEYFDDTILPAMEIEAEKRIEENVVALDWLNGRRYPYLNESVCAAISGLTLGTKAPSIYCALIKATVFGSKRIYESLIANGLKISRLICVGGIARKSKLIMQMLSDALNVPIMVCKEEQVCAKGAAIYAAVAAGYFDSVSDAQGVFCETYHANYFPDEKRNRMYEKMYQDYLRLGNFVENEM